MYELNKESAEKGSGSNSNFLEEGLHEVTIEQAYEVKAGTGAKGVHIDFKSKSGGARGLVFYTHNKQGEAIFGMDQLQAIMAVCKVRQINTQAGLVKARQYNEQSKSYEDVQLQAQILMELISKPLELILRKEANTHDGATRARYAMSSPLVSGTKQTALEVLNSKEAKSWGAILASALASSEKAEKQISQAQNQPASPSSGPDYGAPSGGADYLDDDIPF